MDSPKTGALYAQTLYDVNELNYDSKIKKNRIKKIVDLIDGNSYQILDIGCYNGTIGKNLIDLGNIVYGIEINQEAANEAKSKGLKVEIQNIEDNFHFPDNFFDIVIAGEIIEHILDTDFFMNEITRVLKPKGVLIITTPNAASLGRRLLLLIGKNIYFEASLGFPINAHAGHIRFFVKELLINYLINRNFKLEKYTTDGVNFSSNGKIHSIFLGKVFPSLGQTIIVKAISMKEL